MPGFPHHVIHRGNNRRRIASFISDYTLLLRLLESAAAATGCLVHAGALLANHLHLMVTPPAVESLEEFVRRWAQRYARQRNRARDGSGKLFEGRFQSHPLRDEAAVAAVTRYIDLNPVRAGLVAAPSLYRWSTAARHLGDGGASWPETLWHPSDWYLSLGHDGPARALAYRHFLEADEDGREQRPQPEQQPPPEVTYSRRLLRPDGRSAREHGAPEIFYDTAK
jgi:putative transposase